LTIGARSTILHDMKTAANDNATSQTIIIADIGYDVTAVSLGCLEVRIAENHGHDNWMASAATSGSPIGAFAGKTYKSHARAVKAASKWLTARAS
jgi:hypothetical protein